MTRFTEPLALTIFLLCIHAVAIVGAEKPVVPNRDDTLRITIGQITVTDMQVYDTLPVTLRAAGCAISAFDLRLGCNSQYMEIIEILPGDFLDSCRWEFFNARRESVGVDSGRPQSLWQVVAIAEMISDSAHPVCYVSGREASLVKLVLSSGEASRIPDTATPVYFWWERCSDNTISDQSGNNLMMSTRVFDISGRPFDTVKRTFPSGAGAPDHCIKAAAVNPPVRRLEFHNGGVISRFDPGGIPADSSAADR
ncbi:MAG: hypothetical protein OEW00_09665 [candidate division Zixibacteria bacterium]|nr:hypothetical protein [candidate division Zixibacteria bacterium]